MCHLCSHQHSADMVGSGGSPSTDDATPFPCDRAKRPDPAPRPGESYPLLVTSLRVGALLVALLCWWHQAALQARLDETWAWLLTRPWFRTVYFETWWTTLVYGVIMTSYPVAFGHIRAMDRFKLDPEMRHEALAVWRLALNAVVYMAPLALMDTVLVKRYPGVPQAELELRRRHWVQTERPLPEAPPLLGQVTWHLTASLLLFDLLFFLLHVGLHRSAWLYRLVHAHHHRHGRLQGHVTNQLSVAERLLLVLSANECLKLVRAHPFTRTLYVPLFVGLLVENHSGYDLPWAPHRLLPWGLWGGAPAHWRHHEQGARHYQPFLTYLDRALLAWARRRAANPAPACPEQATAVHSMLPGSGPVQNGLVCQEMVNRKIQ